MAVQEGGRYSLSQLTTGRSDPYDSLIFIMDNDLIIENYNKYFAAES